ncbi:MAG TPA: extracellular solute-binding protein, partial [Phycisphaerae bacterium]|nr:extracellular solute-binding protein [Phycisphaerae bacterium]
MTALAWLGVLAAAAAARAGHVETRPDGTTVIHITLWYVPDPSRTDAYTRAEVAAVREFKRQFPKIFAERYRARYQADPAKYGRRNWDKVEVELRQFSGIQVEGVENDLLAIAGGMAADVLYVNFRKSDNYIQNRFLYPLDKPADGYLTGMTKEEVDFRIHPKIWPVIWRQGPGSGKKDTIRLADGSVIRQSGCRGQVWAIPYGGALGKVLLYRKDLFDEKNIPYPTDQWTWEDLFDACRKITDFKRGTYGLQLGRGKHESWHWVTFLWSAGGEVMDYNVETDQWRCVFDSPQAAAALDFYTRLSAEKWTDGEGKVRRGYAYKEPEGDTKWNRGEIAMKFDYVDEKLFSTINPEVTGMVPVPLGPPGPDGKRVRGAELNSRMMGLFFEIKEPAVRDAAWEYVRFYESAPAARIKTRILVEGGLGRFINPKYLRMFGYPEIERLAPKGWSKIFEVAIETGKPEPYGRNCNTAYNLMTVPIEQAEQAERKDELPADPRARLDALQGLLRTANARANEEMIGLVAPEERTRRDRTAMTVLLEIIVVFALVFRYIIRKFTPPTVVPGQRTGWGFRKHAWAYVLLVPAIATVLVWQY